MRSGARQPQPCRWWSCGGRPAGSRGAGEPVIGRAGYCKTYDPRDVDFSHGPSRGTGVDGRHDKWELHENAYDITLHGRAVYASVDAAVLAEKRRHVVLPMAQQVVVDEVYRSPRNQHVEQQQD